MTTELEATTFILLARYSRVLSPYVLDSIALLDSLNSSVISCSYKVGGQGSSMTTEASSVALRLNLESRSISAATLYQDRFMSTDYDEWMTDRDHQDGLA